VPRDFSVLYIAGKIICELIVKMGQKIPFLHSPHSQIMTQKYTGQKISKNSKKFRKFFKKLSKNFRKIPKNVQKIFDV